MTLHPRLRQQLESALGPEPKPSRRLRRLLHDVDQAYRDAERDRAALDRALELVAELVHRGRTAAAVAPQPRGRKPNRLARELRRLFEQAPFAVFHCDANLAITSWNPASERILGWGAADALGRDVAALLFAEADRAQTRAALRAYLTRGAPDKVVLAAQTRDGRTLRSEWQVIPLRSPRGEVAGFCALLIETRTDRFAAAVDASGDGVFDWDLRAQRLWLSDRSREMLGAETGDAPTAWLERVHGEDREGLQLALEAHLKGDTARLEHEHRVRRADGTFRWVLARGAAERDASGRAIRLCGTHVDVTERRQQQERMLHDALHDPLTGLPNRALFQDLVKRSFARARRREGYRFAVLFLDVDRFKNVNDGLGHAVGDELLVEMGRRLQTCLREGDTLARHGGDEFTILLDDVKESSDALIVAERIHQVTNEPFDLSGQQVFSTTSIGIALSAPGYGRPEDLMRDADTAMYRAKAQGRARSVIFDSNMRDRAPELLQLEADLRGALLREEFRVQYLPIIEVASGRILGLEALVRWAHPKRGLMAPQSFVPVAEETGLIVPIGQWVLATATREFQGWRRSLGSSVGGVTLNVNLSSRQLLQPDLVQQFDQILKTSGLEPHDVVFEITENTFHQNDQATAQLGLLKARGYRLYMDDFGTGYSSLNSLYRFQLDSLKIDSSLFRGGSPRGQAPELVKTIVAFARGLGKDVIAEGVETADQLRFVKEVGCGSAQGFFFSRPVDASAARELLARGARFATAVA